MVNNNWVIGLLFVMSFGVLAASDLRDDSKLSTGKISGTYLEVRSSDVWTGPCFANGEVNLTGKEGILAWTVEDGSWEGVELEGLRVVAVVRTSGTLGDPFTDTYPAKSVVIVDARADAVQSAALVEFAKGMAGRLLEDVVWVKSAPIEMEVMGSRGVSFLKAGEFAEVQTRGLNHHDLHCGNESVYYPPLVEVVNATPAYALKHRFAGDGLNSTWSFPLKRSAFLGTFSR